MQSGALLVQRENNSPPTPQQNNTFVFSTHLRQIYVSTWSVMCMLCMIVIAGLFVMQRGNDEFRPYMGGLQARVAGLSPAVSGRLASLSFHMSKGTAMVLVFAYAAAAWTMSNGIILNPVRNGDSITH